MFEFVILELLLSYILIDVFQRIQGYCTWLQGSSNPPNHIIDLSYVSVCVDVHTQLPETHKLRQVIMRVKIGETMKQANNQVIQLYHISSCSDISRAPLHGHT